MIHLESVSRLKIINRPLKKRLYRKERIIMDVVESYLATEDYENKYEYEKVDDPKRVVSDPQFPKKNIIRLSKVEKVVYCIIILVAIIFAFAIVYSITTVQSTSHKSAQLKAGNDRMKDKIGELRQKVSELSKADLVKSIAKKKGLSVNDERVKKTD